MFPVSGAAQFSASDAKLILPSSSEMGAYSRLVSFVPGAPGSRCGMNRFHRPRSRAAAFILSMIGGEPSWAPGSYCSWYSSAWGQMWSAMNWRTSSSIFFDCSVCSYGMAQRFPIARSDDEPGRLIVSAAMSDMTLVTDGLHFPEGPVPLRDGRVLVVEIQTGTITAVSPDGTKAVVATTGGGP